MQSVQENYFKNSYDFHYDLRANSHATKYIFCHVIAKSATYDSQNFVEMG